MSRQKISTQDPFGHFMRLPARELLIERLRKSFNTIGGYYGFEKTSVPFLLSSRAALPLVKAGMLDERPPIPAKTRSGVDFLLSPSAIIPLIRAYDTHKMNDMSHPIKFLFEGDSVFAGTRGDKGIRIRTEWGTLMVGEEGPVAESEIIQVVWKMLEDSTIDLAPIELRLNATGCANCRPGFRSQFVAYYRSRVNRLCKSCRKDLKHAPTRILSCEDEKCQAASAHAPQALDFLCDACKKHFKGILEILDEAKIPYFLEPKLFREGSWYDTFMFEFHLVTVPAEGGEGAAEVVKEKRRRILFAEGGRMSRAGEFLLGKRLDAACGIVFPEALETVIRKDGKVATEPGKPDVFLAHLGELAKRKSFATIESLRIGGISIQESLGRDSIKSQLKIAEKVGAEVALIIGQKEALDNTIIIREVSSGIQETIPQDKLVDFLKRKLKK